jgi:predicted transcriptional regulator
MSTTVKQAVLEIARQLSDESTWDEAMYKLYVRQKIERGLEDEREGRLTSHEDAFRELSK